MSKVFAFVDGFNLYHALASREEWQRYKWLDLHRLIGRFIRDDEELTRVIYFTAYSTWDQQKRNRHKLYVQALGVMPTEVVLGKFMKRSRKDRSSGAVIKYHEEKRTDVNIASYLFRYAYEDMFETAILVSGDTDLTSALETVKHCFPSKRVGVLSPPYRRNTELENAADFSRTITGKDIESSRLPDAVVLTSGKHIHCPTSWQ